MSQPVTQKQCTESKTRSSAQCAHTEPWLAHGAARLRALHSGCARTHCAGPCLGRAPAVSQPAAVCIMTLCRAPLRVSQAYRLPYRSPCCVVSRHSHRPLLSAPLSRYNRLYRDTPQPKLSACHDTNTIS